MEAPPESPPEAPPEDPAEGAAGAKNYAIWVHFTREKYKKREVPKMYQVVLPGLEDRASNCCSRNIT